MIVCLAANASIDKLFEVDRLEEGRIHRPVGFVQTPGGKGLNVARAARALGGEVHAVVLLSGHAGDWIAEGLAAEGVAASVVRSAGETRSSLSVADRSTGDLTEFYEAGPEVPESAWVDVRRTVRGRVGEGSWLAISGSLPLGLGDAGYRDLVAEVRSAGARVAIDAAREPLRLALDAGPEIVKVNAAEAGDLLGAPIAERAETLAAAEELRSRAGGDGHAGIVTRGVDGVVVAAPDGTLLEGRVDVRGPYPVGSGDAFLAGLIVELERSDDWPRAIRSALAAAAANSEVPGAGRLDPVRAERLSAKADVVRL